VVKKTKANNIFSFKAFSVLNAITLFVLKLKVTRQPKRHKTSYYEVIAIIVCTYRCVCNPGYRGTGSHCEPVNACETVTRGGCHFQVCMQLKERGPDILGVKETVQSIQ